MTPPDTNDSFADEVEDRLEKLFGEDFLADDDPADADETSEDSVSSDALSIAEEDAEDQRLKDAESTKAVGSEDLDEGHGKQRVGKGFGVEDFIVFTFFKKNT